MASLVTEETKAAAPSPEEELLNNLGAKLELTEEEWQGEGVPPEL